jgi:hypothetical protein
MGNADLGTYIKYIGEQNTYVRRFESRLQMSLRIGTKEFLTLRVEKVVTKCKKCKYVKM